MNSESTHSSPGPVPPHGLFMWGPNLFYRLCPSAITSENHKASRLNQAAIAPPRHVFNRALEFLCSRSKPYKMADRCDLIRVPASFVEYVPLYKLQNAPSVLTGLKCQAHGWGKPSRICV